MDRNQKPGAPPEKKNDLNHEEVIDLTQVFKSDETEEVIDLTDVLEPPAPVSDAPDELDELDESAIPMLDVVSTEEPTVLPEEPDDSVIDLTTLAPSVEENIQESETKPLEPSMVKNASTVPAGTVSITEQQLEVAVQRVVEKVYGEKIEHLIIQTIEKTIKQEIAEIRQSLIDDNTFER